ncbi:MAG: NtaA/DmoA family FMN-dependent monooxygenase, partial [Novosphingobium sp.]|nr:NtaA/DmoA family FMN-dependent monooxygenase [Novosphingobium sp.]
TSAYKPWSIVRQLGTIDYLSGGRVGWNIVTGHLRNEHRALGLEQVAHDRRYDMADEYMEICYRLWRSIRPGAIVADKRSGIYADTTKIERVTFKGEFFSCDTIAPVLPSPQGRPVLFQAGSSGRGQKFAIEHADVVFAIQPNLASQKKFVAGLNDMARALGRRAPGVSLGIQTVIGGTEEEARAKLAAIIERMPIDACLARLSGTLGVDFSGMDLDQPLQEMRTEASQGLMKAFANIEGDKPLTLREVAIRWGVSVGKPQIVGTPEQVADEMERVWRETGCFGFNMTPHIMPSSVTEFVDEVVPLLQKKGIYRTEYAGTTLRENLGLPMP